MFKRSAFRTGLVGYGLWSLLAFAAATFCLSQEAMARAALLSHTLDSNDAPFTGPGAERYAQAASPFGSIPPPPENLPVKDVPVTPMEKAGPPPGLNPLKGMDKAEPPPDARAMTPMEKAKPEAGKEPAPSLGPKPASGTGTSVTEEKAGPPLKQDDNASHKSKE